MAVKTRGIIKKPNVSTVKSQKKQNIPSICSLKDVSFSYGKQNILEGIKLGIPQGSFTCFIGESGAGKSTLLYILAGLLKPQFGDVLF